MSAIQSPAPAGSPGGIDPPVAASQPAVTGKMDPVTDNPPPDSGMKSGPGGAMRRSGERLGQALSQKPLSAAIGALALGLLVGRLLR